MPNVAPPKYPSSLTVSSWNKAKGLIARISKIKTGVTEELEAAAKAFKAAKFDHLNIVPACEAIGKKEGGLEDYKKLQRDYLEKLQPEFKKLETMFYLLSESLKKKARDFESDEKLAKFAPVLKLMAEDANKFTYAISFGTLSSPNQKYLQELIENRAKSDKMWAEAARNVKTMIDKAWVAGNKHLKKTPTFKEYQSFLKEELRGIGAQIAMAGKGDPTFPDKYMVPMKIAATLWAGAQMPKDDPKELATRLEDDVLLLKKFKLISDKD